MDNSVLLSVSFFYVWNEKSHFESVVWETFGVVTQKSEVFLKGEFQRLQFLSKAFFILGHIRLLEA